MKALFLIGTLTSFALAAAESPYLDMSRIFFNDLIVVSESSKQSGGQQNETSTQKIKNVSDKVDFRKLAEKSLGSKWTKVKKSEKEEFLKVLQELLEVVVYPQAKRISVASEDIKYEMLSGTPPKVQALSLIEREKRGEKIKQKLEVVLIFDSKSKRIVDAVIEGEELSSNLKRQFDEALKKQSFASIIEKMRKKVRETKNQST